MCGLRLTFVLFLYLNDMLDVNREACVLWLLGYNLASTATQKTRRNLISKCHPFQIGPKWSQINKKFVLPIASVIFNVFKKIVQVLSAFVLLMRLLTHLLDLRPTCHLSNGTRQRSTSVHPPLRRQDGSGQDISQPQYTLSRFTFNMSFE